MKKSILAMMLVAGMMSVPAAQAQVGWVDILRPLVNDVLIPGAAKIIQMRQAKTTPSTPAATDWWTQPTDSSTWQAPSDVIDVPPPEPTPTPDV